MPRIGFTPWDLHASYISTAPFITPWSVRPRAGMPSSAARAAIRSILQAPSSSEYSLWTWRWTACAADCEVMPPQTYAPGRSSPPPFRGPSPQLAVSASAPGGPSALDPGHHLAGLLHPAVLGRGEPAVTLLTSELQLLAPVPPCQPGLRLGNALLGEAADLLGLRLPLGLA